MSYVEKNLMPGEKVVYRGKLHWAIFLAPMLWLFLGIMISSGPDGAGLGGAVIGLSCLTFIVRLISQWTSEFAVTNKKVVVKVGLIRRKTIELLLNKVESLNVDQGIIGRILGFGTLKISGSGGSVSPFPMLGKPMEFRNNFYQVVESNKNGDQDEVRKSA